MGATVSIVMYHYVRDLEHSRFPEIKGLRTGEFREQIAYLKKHYTLVSGDDFLDAIANGEGLPPRALLLTFDDGYVDHFSQVFPILDEEQVPGCFFVPAKCILENKVLDVNKIHFILASVDKRQIIDSIFRMLDDYRGRYSLLPNEYYWNRLAKPGRLDPKEVMFIKRILQRELPEEVRAMIVDALFARFVTADEAGFARELYMSIDQLKCLIRHGMYVGSHGYNHVWLDTLARPSQEEEVERSLDFLASIGSRVDRWMMCYPYGAYDDSLLSVLRRRGCLVGLSTKMGIADCHTDNHLALPRIDTNYLPPRAAAPVEWLAQAGSLQ